MGVGWAWVLVFPFIAATLITQALRLVGSSWRVYIVNLRVPVTSSAAVVAMMTPALYLFPAGLLRLTICGLVACVTLLGCYLSTSECRQMLPNRVVAFGRRFAFPLAVR